MKHFFLIVIILMLYNRDCSGKEPKISVDEILELKGVASASGIEKTAPGIYVIGDNSPYIFLLDEKLQVLEKHLLFPGNKISDSIYEKSVKPDLEAICKPDEAGEMMWLFGSGSGYPTRDILVVFNPNNEPKVVVYSLVDFYAGLREAARLSKNELNIEAAVVVRQDLYLFNRGKNIVFRLKLSDFQEFLNEPGKLPQPDILRFDLPEINGITAGFSGASYVQEKEIFLITASVENTANWIDDGEVLGSFFGVLNYNDFSRNMKPNWTLLTYEGLPLLKKVESITSLFASAKDSINLLMVTDSDGGISEIIKARLIY